MDQNSTVSYKPCMQLISVQCSNCKQRYGGGSVIAVDVSSLHTLALSIHDNSKVICGDPVLVIQYDNYLFDTRSLPQEKETEIKEDVNIH